MKHCEWCGRAYDYTTYGSTINYCSEKCKKAQYPSNSTSMTPIGCASVFFKLIWKYKWIILIIIALALIFG